MFSVSFHADRILTGGCFAFCKRRRGGRMEINTALNLVLGTALVLIKVETRRGFVRRNC